VDAVLAAITAALKRKDEVRLAGFGTFVAAERKAVLGVILARRGNADPRIDHRSVQGRQGFEGLLSTKRRGAGARSHTHQDKAGEGESFP